MRFAARFAALSAVLCMLPALYAQELPAGEGKDLVASQCASCHGLEQVTAHRDSKDGWDGVVGYMVSRGMSATNDEVKIIVDYLAKSFPSPPPAPKPVPAKGK
ncbi:MAG: hypothetical protein ABI811_15760 [Acidobacteriota bacterium]